jgi:cation diffusion facilitator CzcD-associated flavoprotein CzcO
VAVAVAQAAIPAPAMPVAPHTDIAIIGAGFAGLGMAMRLRGAGMRDLVILERGDDVGGTWRDNTYPGCTCDVPSHLYSYSFLLNPRWSRSFSPQWEIQEYLRRCARETGVIDCVRLGVEVRNAAWDEQAGRWLLQTSAGPRTARVLIAAMGGLSDPAIPDIKGLSSFHGRIFHSARWDHDHDLHGERVATIGTGASAIQFIPQIQPRVGRLHVFQRTPPWIAPRNDRSITRLERWLFTHVPGAQRIPRAGIYLAREAMVPALTWDPRLLGGIQAIAQRHLQRQVRDPELRARLRPSYRIGCKRILISNDYYPSLTQPNVEVVSEGIREIRDRAIVTTDGAEREVDTIILGTGFHVTDMPAMQHIRGRGGLLLADAWADGMAAHLGTTIAGFPNLFMMIGPSTGLGHTSIVVMIESQAAYVVDCLRWMQRSAVHAVEVSEAAQQGFVDSVQRRMQRTVWMRGGCASWYMDASGRITTLWPRSTWDFRRRTRRFDPAAYHVTSAVRQAAAVL